MRVLFHFTRLPEGEILRIEQEGREVYILMDELADRSALAWELSVATTRMLREGWVYVGDNLAEPAA